MRRESQIVISRNDCCINAKRGEATKVSLLERVVVFSMDPQRASHFLPRTCEFSFPAPASLFLPTCFISSELSLPSTHQFITVKSSSPQQKHHSRKYRRGEEKSSPHHLSISPKSSKNPIFIPERFPFSWFIQIYTAIYSVLASWFGSWAASVVVVNLRESDSPETEGGPGGGGEVAVLESARRPVAGRSRHPSGVAGGVRRGAPPRRRRFAEEFVVVLSCTWQEEIEKGHSFSRIVKNSLNQRLGLSRTESDPSQVKVVSVKSDARNSVRRCLLNTLSDDGERSNEVARKIQQDAFPIVSIHKEPLVSSAEPLQLKATGENLTVSSSNVAKVSPQKNSPVVPVDENSTQRTQCEAATCSSGQNSPVFYAASSGNELENSQDNDSERSTVTSNSCAGDNDRDEILQNESSSCNCDGKTGQDSEAASSDKNPDPDGSSEITAASIERKPFISKRQWLLKLGRPSGEDNIEKGSGTTSDGKDGVDPSCSSPSDGNSNNLRGSTKLASGDKVMGTFRTLGQNMLENIQVIESAFQHEHGQPDGASQDQQFAQ